jgi:hypothetical protein
MLSGHTILVAVIFVPYMVMMGGLFAYIIHTGYRPGQRDEDSQPDAASDDEDPDLLLVA